MNNKTKTIIKISCGILLILMIQIIGVTYAKYITTEKATGSANIAKWGFDIVKNGELTKTVSLVDSTNTSIAEGKIAPGAEGTIEIEVNAKKSEVNVDYSIIFENEKNKPTNMIFRYNGNQYNSLSSITDIIGTIKHDSQIRTKVIKISWEWPYQTGKTAEEKNQNNILDTQEAQTISEYEFDIKVTGTQGK